MTKTFARMLLHSVVVPVLCIGLSLVAPVLAIKEDFMPIDQLGLGYGERYPFYHEKRAMAVRKAWKQLWKSYRKHAYPHDTFKPLDWDNPYVDDFYAWQLTTVESLGTAIIMGHKKPVKDIMKRLRTVDFEKTYSMNQLVDVSDVTTRYLGALLSAFDLLRGPYLKTSDEYGKQLMLDHARNLVKGLMVAFDTPTGIPDTHVALWPYNERSNATINTLAGVGGMVLEFTRFGDIMEDPQYHEIVHRAQEYLHRPEPASKVPFPGLSGTLINITDGKFLDDRGSWGVGGSAFYENLIKMFVYDPLRFYDYKERWIVAADSAMEHLASVPSTAKHLIFMSEFIGNETYSASTQSACSNGAHFLIGGMALRDKKYLDFGLKLAESCYQLWEKATSGIGPDKFRWIDARAAHGDWPGNRRPPHEFRSFYDQAGFWPTTVDYSLRPEVMESVYYAWRATRDTKWQARAWNMFRQMRRLCSTRRDNGRGAVRRGWVPLSNVMELNGGRQRKGGQMDSIVMAKTLKFMFLMFASPKEHVQAQRETDAIKRKFGNRFLFTTGGHPIQVWYWEGISNKGEVIVDAQRPGLNRATAKKKDQVRQCLDRMDGNWKPWIWWDCIKGWVNPMSVDSPRPVGPRENW
ncbi:hypothetical protein QQX98_010742 [Neonectria punicea]|uniref:alpha-1,2-Mannosidase n=1 Tax=Neonectria punicea TaxID=979145 RepID=A0ABR1GNQ3_9HYPO